MIALTGDRGRFLMKLYQRTHGSTLVEVNDPYELAKEIGITPEQFRNIFVLLKDKGLVDGSIYMEGHGTIRITAAGAERAEDLLIPLWRKILQSEKVWLAVLSAVIGAASALMVEWLKRFF